MYKRAFDHVHDTNAGVDVSFRYYLWQLGYGLFPWSGLAVAGLMHWIGRQRVQGTKQGALTPAEVSSFFALWFIAAFGMFTLSGTKFHHYILPAVPPLGALTGMVLHELLGHPEQRRRPALYLALLSGATLCALLGLALWMGGPGGLVPVGVSGLPRSPGIGSVLLCAAGVLVLVALRYGKSTEEPVASPAVPTAAWFALLGALGAWLVGRDLLARHGEDLPGQVLLMQLFSYQYQRGWPESLDFEGSLIAFSSVSVLLFIGMLQQRSRSHATVALCALSVLWCAWGVNVYLVQAAPHWGQRASIAAYYRLRKTHEPPLIAYQMNWKGENFYTGNRVATFVKSGKPFEHWLEKQRRAGVRTLYFSTEPSRADSLKRQLGAHQRFEVLTSPRVNTRFMIARVEL
jgi:hypothetical protein